VSPSTSSDGASARALHGCGTALVTPFGKDGGVDEKALRALVDWQIAEGIHFLVPCGSTGEAATLTNDEHVRVVAIVAEQAAGRVPVVAGLNQNDTAAAVRFAKRIVSEARPSHVMVVGPPYNRPPQRGFIAHYQKIADAIDTPVVIYNVPGRTGSNILANTTLALAEHENIVAVKEACGSIDQILQVILHRPEAFSVLSGDDPLTVPVMALGGDGIVSVVSNAVPGPMSRLTEAMDRGDLACARSLMRSLQPIMITGFSESNPMPMKAAMNMLGRMEDVLRLPLVTLAGEHRDALREALRAAGAL
jgi:4-hydroxy-tetrahydrodipicolinate synthase